jgi:transcriptional regulator with XRE-family HTH domain
MAFDLDGACACSHADKHATNPASRPNRRDAFTNRTPDADSRHDHYRAVDGSAKRHARRSCQLQTPCGGMLGTTVSNDLRGSHATRCELCRQLKTWRGRRGLAQLALAGRANISQRHLSFLELGRASPSREMVDRLAGALDLPLRQHNALLLAAGFAPEWRARDLAAPDLAEVTRALDYILAQQEPYPAVVVDRHWNLLRANAGAGRLVEFLVGPIAPGTAINLADALVAPDVLRPYIVNWTQVVRHFIRSVEADARATDCRRPRHCSTG